MQHRTKQKLTYRFTSHRFFTIWRYNWRFTWNFIVQNKGVRRDFVLYMYIHSKKVITSFCRKNDWLTVPCLNFVNLILYKVDIIIIEYLDEYTSLLYDADKLDQIRMYQVHLVQKQAAVKLKNLRGNRQWLYT